MGKKKRGQKNAPVTHQHSSYFVGLNGRAIKMADEQSPHYNEFMGIRTGQRYDFSDTLEGLKDAYLASALSIRCIQIRAHTLASIPRRIVKLDETELPQNHPLEMALGKRRNKLFRYLESDLCIWGNAYCIPIKKAANRWEFQRLNPSTIEVVRDQDGIDGYRQRINGQITGEWYPEDVIQAYSYNPEDDLAGLSLMQGILRTLGVDLSLEEFAKVYFENDATPAGLLTTDKIMQQPDRERYKAEWEQTFRGVEKQFKVALLDVGTTYTSVTPPLKDLAMKDVDEKVMRRIALSFGVPMTIVGMTEASNYATIKEQHQILYTETVIPEAEMVFDAFNEHPFIKQFGVIIEPDTDAIEVLQEDRTEITTRSTQAFIGGIRSLNEARELENLKPLPVDVFILPNVGVVTRTDLEAGRLPQPQLPAPTFPGFGVQAALGAGTTLEPTKDAEGSDFCILYKIGSQPDLVALQNQLKNQYPDAEWVNPDEFHITLFYAPAVADPQGIISAIEQLDAPQPTLQIGSLHSFDNLGSHALHFRLRRNSELLDFQHELYELCKTAGIQPSAYSDPTAYIPHITIAYLPEKPPAITYHSKLKVTPTALVISSEDSTLFEQALEPSAAPLIIEGKAISKTALMRDAFKAYERDIQAWKKKIVNKGLARSLRFEPHFLPSAYADFIRIDLENGEAPEILFSGVLEAFKAVDEELPTPEEFEAYWQGIGGLYDAIVDGVQNAWGDVLPRLAEAIRAAGQAANLEPILAELDQRQQAALADELVKVYLAGAARGNDLLNNVRLSANPIKAAGEVGIAWDIINTDAAQWAQQTSSQQIAYIGQTTRQTLQDEIGKWIESGESLDKLADVIEGKLDIQDMTVPSGFSPNKLKWLISPERARLIAQTETTNAYHQGVSARWKQAGVKEFRFRTQNDRSVCALCKRLNNKVGTLGQGVYDPVTGKYYSPAVHGGCRCFASPIL